MAEPQVIWTKEAGANGLEQVCQGLKAGFKRSLYNTIRQQRQIVDDTCKRVILDKDYSSVALVESTVDSAIRDIKSRLTTIRTLMDKDLFVEGAKEFESISFDGDVYTAVMGRLDITWKGATYDIGDMVISYKKTATVNRGMGYDRIRVRNTRKPSTATVPHPHVNGEGQVCFGTWKEMMGYYASDQWGWLRSLVSTAKFLKHYTPEGTPYQKMISGWRTRHVGGITLCQDCERTMETCTCIRQGDVCPKTGERRRTLPNAEYCTGCARLLLRDVIALTPALAEIVQSEGLLRGDLGACCGERRAGEFIALAQRMTQRPSQEEGRSPNWERVVGDAINRAWAVHSGALNPEEVLYGETPRPTRNRLNYNDLPLSYRQNYVFAEQENSATVYRCKRPTIVETERFVPHGEVESMRVLRILSAESAARVREAGLIEYRVSSPTNMVVRVTGYVGEPSYLRDTQTNNQTETTTGEAQSEVGNQ